jgi:hypothetical protein
MNIGHQNSENVSLVENTTLNSIMPPSDLPSGGPVQKYN